MTPDLANNMVLRVQSSFERCLPLNAFANHFYKNLFAQNPQVAEYFKDSDFELQNTQLIQGIWFLISYYNRNPIAAMALQNVKIKHNHDHLDIPDRLYKPWTEQLIESLREHDSKFSDALELDWRTTIQPGIDLISQHTGQSQNVA